MEIRILNGGCGRKINAAVMASALLSGCKITSLNPFVRFEVSDWNAFLHIYWISTAEFSKAFAVNSSNTKIHVMIIDDIGRQFQTDVWYSVEHKGVHYVSLY